MAEYTVWYTLEGVRTSEAFPSYDRAYDRMLELTPMSSTAVDLVLLKPGESDPYAPSQPVAPGDATPVVVVNVEVPTQVIVTESCDPERYDCSTVTNPD